VSASAYPAQKPRGQSAPQSDEIADLETEDDLATTFVVTYGDTYRYTHGMDWMTCQPGQHYWRRDDKLERFDDARKLARVAAWRAQKPAERKGYASAKMVNSIITLARSDRSIALAPDAWDADGFALNTPDGIVDLRTGQLRERRCIDYVTHCARVSPSRASECPLWDRFLAEVFLGDRDVIEFVQRLVGYTLTADRREQLLFFCYGLGANGKSTFWDFIQWLLGSYAMKLPATVLMQSQLQNHPTELAQLQGRRLALSSELEEGQYWAEARIKELTGDEILRARFMRQDFFEFRMTQKHVIVGNFKPRLKGGDHALARRFVLVPFRAKFAAGKRDPNMLAKLRAEGPAVLRWAIEGAVKWHAEGLAIPPAVVAASGAYMAENDDLLLWVEERCFMHAGARSQSSPLYEDYVKWLRSRGQQAPSMKLWGERMSALEGVTKRKSDGVMVYVGIGLRTVE